MKGFKAFLAFFGVAAGVAVAQVPPESESARPRNDIAALLHVDATRAARVTALLDLAHRKARAAREQIGEPVDETTRAILYAAFEAIRTDTEEKLAKVLSEEEMQRLLAALPPPPPREPLRFRRA